MATRWFRLRFRLTGSLHVGSGRWGYVRRGRPYLPGWTLWGALTNLSKRNGKITGMDTFTKVGQYLDHNFWLGHLTLLQAIDGNREIRYLPTQDAASGKTVFQWLNNDNKPVSDCKPPLAFRAGVVRGRPDNDPLGRHFITEAIGSSELNPYHLGGWYLSNNGHQLPLEIGDRLPVGGNRQTSGAVITLVAHEDSGEPNLGLCSHYRLDCKSLMTVSGAVERIVMRRTKEEEGFGRCYLDWGLHAAPGWQFADGVKKLSPVKVKTFFFHGTVHPCEEGKYAVT